jgi:hypothetical protein
MRWLALAVLLAVPLALVAWVRWAAVHDAPPEFVPPQAVSAGGAGAREAEAGLLALFGAELPGLTRHGEASLYDEKTLFDAIDGAAPLFLGRRFRRLLSTELQTASGKDLTCDVYDMTDAEHASAIFEKERSGQARAVEGWPEAVTGPMSLVFHQGRFYVKLTAFEAESEAALPALARALQQRMR